MTDRASAKPPRRSTLEPEADPMLFNRAAHEDPAPATWDDPERGGHAIIDLRKRETPDTEIEEAENVEEIDIVELRAERPPRVKSLRLR